MKYELQTLLEEAGFPSGKDNEADFDENRIWVEPSLSELIEACGDSFQRLQKHHKVFYATSNAKITTEKCPITGFYGAQEIVVKGNTPEEAVAKLWLEINKK